MCTVIETPEFIACAQALWTEAERNAFIEWIASHPEAGDGIPTTSGLHKVRFSRAGMGKRGGARVIYFNRLQNGEIILLLMYAKAKFDTIRSEILLKIKEKYHV